MKEQESGVEWNGQKEHEEQVIPLLVALKEKCDELNLPMITMVNYMSSKEKKEIGMTTITTSTDKETTVYDRMPISLAFIGAIANGFCKTCEECEKGDPASHLRETLLLGLNKFCGVAAVQIPSGTMKAAMEQAKGFVGEIFKQFDKGLATPEAGPTIPKRQSFTGDEKFGSN